MQPYTIIGLYNDNQQPFSTIVHARDPQAAKIRGVEWALDINGWNDDDAYCVDIIAVIMGVCELAVDSGKVENGRDIFEEHSVNVDIMASYSA